jgi:hypothetical protein
LVLRRALSNKDRNMANLEKDYRQQLDMKQKQIIALQAELTSRRTISSQIEEDYKKSRFKWVLGLNLIVALFFVTHFKTLVNYMIAKTP